MSAVDDANSDLFYVAGSSEPWLLSVVKEAMFVLYTNTRDRNFETAVGIGRIYAQSDDEKEQMALLAVFLRKELSGDLLPPPSLRKLYKSIIHELEAA